MSSRENIIRNHSQDPFVNREEPQHRWLFSNDIRMHYLQWGKSGQSVIALHGLASSAHWYSLVLPLLDRQFQRLAFDQRAHGKTEQTPTGYDWGTLATDIIGAMDELEIQTACIIGHSWGASVAAHLAAIYPTRVSRLVLIDGGIAPQRSTKIPWESFKERLSPRDIYGPRERYISSLRNQFTDVWTDQLEQIVMTMVKVNSDGTVDEILEPLNHEQVLYSMWNDPASNIFGDIKAPTILVPAGPKKTVKKDFATRKMLGVQEAMDKIPGARLHWIEDTVHDIAYDQPSVLANVIQNFLESTPE